MASGQIHRSKMGTYHPAETTDAAWTIHDSRGYMDGGSPCDECGACECGTTCAECNNPPHECEEHNPESECCGLSFSYVCLDGGDNLCEECAEKEGIEITDCNCA